MKEIAVQNLKSIVLIGFMGAGKTSVGCSLAQKLNWDFIDIDTEIEKFYNLPTTEIFRVKGEKAFRDQEKELITTAVLQYQKVISVGGGAFLQDEIKKACLENAIVVFLDITWKYWKERIPLLIDSRPLLQNKSLEEVQGFFKSRQPIYSQHHVKLLTDKKTINEVAEEIKGRIIL